MQANELPPQKHQQKSIDTLKVYVFMGSGLAISLFIFPLNFSNRSAHGSIMHADIFCYIF